MTPLIGTKAWFGPRRFGWGLGPVSPEGWAVTALSGALLWFLGARRVPATARAGVLAAVLTVVVLKGTAPGGPRARAAFDEAASGRGGLGT